LASAPKANALTRSDQWLRSEDLSYINSKSKEPFDCARDKQARQKGGVPQDGKC